MPRLYRALALALLALPLACGPKAKVESKSLAANNEHPTSGSTGGSSGATTSGTSGGSSASASSSAGATSGSGTSGSSSAGSTGSTGSTGTDGSTPDLGDCTPVGTVLQATTNVNLRQGPSTSYAVIVVVSKDAQVTTINQEQPQNGFYNVSYGGVQGWTYADYYLVVSVPAGASACTPASGSTGSTGTSGSTGGSGSTGSSGASMRDTAVERAQSAMGFSYWWGHGRFLPTGPTSAIAGSCTGSCPSCTHSGSYGGDCSGMVGKAWQLGNPDITVDGHPYSTYNFYNQSVSWHDVDRGSVQKGDALVYNQNGAGHIFLYESGDGWGSMWAYECKGCAAGCVHDLRTAGSAYKGIAHDGW